MSGTKVESVDTGMILGGQKLVLTYDSGENVNDAGAAHQMSFGRYWTSSMHKRLWRSATSANLQRGDGTVISFTALNNIFSSTSVSNKSTLIVTSGGYLFTDAATGTLESYNQLGQLVTSTDLYGRTLNFNYSTVAGPSAPAAGYLMQVVEVVSGSAGRYLLFSYTLPLGASPDTGGKISKITDSSGQAVMAAYNAGDNLSTLTWADGKLKTFVYENTNFPWALTGVIDENNSRFATWAYDTSGRAISSVHAGGVDFAQVDYGNSTKGSWVETFNVAEQAIYRTFTPGTPDVVTVTNAMGNSSTLSHASVQGRHLITGSSQPAGSGCTASNSASAFDSNGNLISKDDFSGQRICYAYDSKNREVARIEGLSNTTECATAWSNLPRGARKVTTAWHPIWKLPTAVNEPGRETLSIYNGQPDAFTGGIAACTAQGQLPNGTAPVPLCSRVHRDKLDVNGIATTSNVDASFDSVSLLLHGDGNFTDSSPRTKSLAVKGSASISAAERKHGGGSVSFDGSGWLEVGASSDFNLSTGDFTLETFVRPNASTYHVIFGSAATTGTIFQLHLSGTTPVLMLRSSSGEGLTYYNGAPVQVNSWTHLAFVRKSGILYMFTNGVLSGQAASTQSLTPGTSDLMYLGGGYGGAGQAPWYKFNGYIDEFRLTKGVGRYTTSFIPPVQKYGDVVNANYSGFFERSSYTYDANGRVLTSKDSLGRTTTYAYYTDTAFTGTYPTAVGHTVGDLQSVTNAAGQVTRYEQYDKAGRIIQSTDAKGNTTIISYTPRGWVSQVSVTAPGQSARTTNYAYDNVGQLTGVTNPDGSTISYSYDAAHRLIGATDAKGNTVAYTLDNMGNRIKEDIKDPSGVLQRSISRSFDALNRVQQVTGSAQ